MAENVALPLLLPNPPHSRPIFPNNHHTQHHPPLPSPPPPISPIIQDLLLLQNPKTSSHSETNTRSPVPRTRNRIGKSRDPNRGKPWSHRRLSLKGQKILQTLIDPLFDSAKLHEVLLQLFEPSSQERVFSSVESLSFDVSGIIKGLRFNKKNDLALSVFEWVRNHKDCKLILNGSIVAVVIGILGKQGRVSAAKSLLHNLQKDGLVIDVYVYTSLISACSSNERYKEAVMLFKKMEEEGCKPTLITYNVILNVYGKMSTPWNKIMDVVDGMKSAGIAPDLYTYNTLISCCCRGSLYEEAAALFEEMKSRGFTPDKVTYNAFLDVYGKSRRPKEAMEVLREMELNGFAPSIVTYNSLISAYARDGLLDEAMDLKNQMVERGIKPDVITYTTLLSGFEKSGKDESAMKVFKEMESAGCKPNICTFNALIKMYGNRGMFEEMMKVFEEIGHCSCTPDIVTWNTLLAVFGQNDEASMFVNNLHMLDPHVSKAEEFR